MGNPRDKQIADALRVADKSNELLDANKELEIRRKVAEAMRKHQLDNLLRDDERLKPTPEQYRRGNLGYGKYALSNGGRAGYALGGEPTNLPTDNYAIDQIDPTQSYVQSLYQNVMGRAGDQAGIDYWTNQLNEGNVSQSDILHSFAQSPEFQSLYKADPSQAVGALYQTALGRSPDKLGLDYWTQQAQSGLDLGQMVSGFTGSEEGEAVDYINQLYQNYYGTNPTQSQLQQSMAQLSGDPDISSFINKTFPLGYNDPNLVQEAANKTKSASDASVAGGANVVDPFSQFGSKASRGIQDYLSRMGNFDPLNAAIRNINWDNAAILKQGLESIGIPPHGVYSALGNFNVESIGIRPDRIEGIQSKPYKNKALEAFRQRRLALSNQLKGDDWQNVDLSELAKGRLGIGVGQWTGDRAVDLIEEAKRQGVDWRDMNFQTQYLIKDTQEKHPEVIEYYKNNPPNPARDIAVWERVWENPATGAGRKSAKERFSSAIAAAQYFGDAPESWGKFSVSPLVTAAKQQGAPQVLPAGYDASQDPAMQKYLADKKAYDDKVAQYLYDQAIQGKPLVVPSDWQPPVGPIPQGNAGATLAQQGAGGNIAGGGMFNPGGGAIGAPADSTSGIGSTAGFPTWTPQSTGSLPAVNQVPVNYTQIGTFDPYTSQQTSMGWDPMTGIGLHSPLYAGPGQYINPGISPTATNFSGTLAFGPGFKHGGAVDDALRIARATGGGAWTRKEGKNPKGGLNEKGRASLRAQGHDIKRPQPEGGSRKDSFCARMKGMKAKLTSAETANDPNSRINKSLRVWNCHSAGGAVDNALKIAKYPERKKKDWMISHDYEDRGGEMKEMSPDEFLGQTRKLKGTDEERWSINSLKGAMKRGDHFDPLQLLANGMEDGRHRATAAKELGIKKVPVIDFRKKRADGGPIDDRAHEFVREQLDTGEPQVRQYVEEADFPARAARGVEAADRYAAKVNNLLASVAGQKEMMSPEDRRAGEIVKSALPVDPYDAVRLAEKQYKSGDTLGAAETMVGGMPMQGAIRAYHGTPHWFDKFDISKIGTGEGAQAYGHGLYFADREGVARSYRDAVSNMQEVTPHLKFEGSTIYRGHDLNDLTPAQIAAQSVAELGGIDQSRRTMLDFSKSPYTGKMWSDALAELEANPERFKDIAWQKPGYMYEVDIHANPSHMLDWDKPLTEQSRHVIERFNEAVSPVRDADDAMLRELFGDKSAHASLNLFDRSKGSQAYRTFADERGGAPVVSERLRKAGIPGIQYLDAGSRGAGEGSRNYVVFDPDIVEILRRYARGGEVWDKPRPKSLGKPDPLTSKEKSKAKRMAKAAGRPWPNLVDNMRAARADGGELEADVSYAPDLPLMAQRDPNAEIADAMRVASEDKPVKYDTGPVEGEATLKPYEPTLKEKIYQTLAGTEQRPSPERAQFSRGVSELAEFTPGLGNVMAAQEAARRGDTKGVIMAALPIPGAATEARMAKAAVSESGGLNNWLSKKYPNVDFAVSEPRAGHITVDKIVVPKELRNQGIGTQFMQDVAAYADASGKPLALSPSADFGGSKQKLTEWYKSLGFVPNKGRSQDFTISESMVRRPEQVAESYQGSHQSPGPENGAPLWRMHQIYPDDLYSSQGFRYYADFGQPYDQEGYYHATRFRHNPNASVTIYRAVPKDADIKNINKGDWVTLTKDYAKDHGESALQGDYKILQKSVKARDLFTHGDSIHEFGYHPQPMMKDDEFVSKLTPNEAKEKLSRISGSARQSLRKALEARSVQERRYGGAVQNALRIAKGR